jgi:uncharacterized membrane protein
MPVVIMAVAPLAVSAVIVAIIVVVAVIASASLIAVVVVIVMPAVVMAAGHGQPHQAKNARDQCVSQEGHAFSNASMADACTGSSTVIF